MILNAYDTNAYETNAYETNAYETNAYETNVLVSFGFRPKDAVALAIVFVVAVSLDPQRCLK